MVEVVLLPFWAKYRVRDHSRTRLRDWTTATSMEVLVFVRVCSGASAQLSGALCGEQYTS